MFKSEFKRIAEKENGKFYFEDKDISIGLGVRSPNVTYIIKFEYNNSNFTIYNRTGTAYVGEISCDLPSTTPITHFEITSISHLLNLFIRKKSRFKIKSENKNLNYFLENNLALKQLNKIAKKENFSPLIHTYSDNKQKKIITKYHLEFNNWTQVIEPIIELFKNLTDEFEKGIFNISENSYREMN